jgi:hypothetical protein
VLDERVGRDHADQGAVAVDDQYSADVGSHEVLGGLLRRRTGREHGRVGEHAVADEGHGQG